MHVLTKFLRGKAINPNLKSLPHDDLVKELKRINDSFDWKKLAKKQRALPVSVIILVLDNLELTSRCINSVLAAKSEINFELLVFNNGSGAETSKGLRALHQKHPDFRLISHDQNLNFAVGNNMAFSRSRGKICVFLNNDTYVTDYWLDRLIAPIEKGIARITQPLLLYPDETVQCAGVVFSKESVLGYPLYAGIKKNRPGIMKSHQLQAVTAACMAVASKDFASIKGFDPSYINGQEDVDFCLRLGGKTRQCLCVADSVVYHDESKTPGRGAYIVQNRTKFVERWEGKIVPDDVGYYQKDGYRITGWQDSPAGGDERLTLSRPVLRRSNGKIKP